MTRPDEAPQNDDLRQLFSEATSGIRPEGTFEEIRSRTEKVDPMARSWFLPSIAAAAVMALVIGGAFYVNRDDAKPSGHSGPDFADTAKAKDLPIYYLGDTAAGLGLFREEQPIDATPGEGKASYLLGAAEAAVSGHPLDADYRSAWPTTLTVNGTGRNPDDPEGALTVFFNSDAVTDRPSGMTEAEAKLSVEQLVRTMQAAGDTDAPVQFQVVVTDGQVDTGPLTKVLGVPIPAEGATPQPDADVLAPVQITSPTDNQKIKAGEKFTVTGVANVFEANVQWELLIGGDAVVDSGFTTAEECCRLAPYSFDLTLEPGTYTLEVHDSDESGTGRPINRDTKEIVVE